MLNQTELRKETGIPYGRLKTMVESGVVTYEKGPRGRFLYGDSSVAEVKKYMSQFDNSGMTLKEFAGRVHLTSAQVAYLVKKGYLTPDHLDMCGKARFTDEQAGRIGSGDFARSEEGFYSRHQVAEKFGVSVSLVAKWESEGLLTADHRGFYGLTFYKAEEVDDLYFHTEKWHTKIIVTKLRGKGRL